MKICADCKYFPTITIEWEWRQYAACQHPKAERSLNVNIVTGEGAEATQQSCWDMRHPPAAAAQAMPDHYCGLDARWFVPREPL